MGFRTETFRLATVFGALFVAGCGTGAQTATGTGQSIMIPPEPAHAGTPDSHFTRPALMTIDSSGALAYWPIRPNGGITLQPISKPLKDVPSPYGIAGQHDELWIANYKPAQVVGYNVNTLKPTVLSDPHGRPLDVAVGKDGTIYALNSKSVTVFAHGSSKTSKLSCSQMTNSEAIAVNNEGDIFVDGYGPGSFLGVIEYRRGKGRCFTPNLNPVEGYVGGVGVDPKTDDLITIDDPSYCAGSPEGRMFIYPKPYSASTGREVILGATYCSGRFRLNARSTLIFVSDGTVSAGFPVVDQFRYPDGRAEGTYQVGRSPSGSFGPFMPIPNRLPN